MDRDGDGLLDEAVPGRAASRPATSGRSGAWLRAATLAAAALAVVVGAGLVAGCGGDDGDGATGLSGADPAPDDGTGSGGGEGGEGADLPPVEDAVVMEGDEVAVTSLDNLFRAPAIEVEAGTTVVWTNKGRNEHDVLPSDGNGWGVEVDDFQPGDVYRHTFDEPGTYHYYCSIHGTTTEGMVGAVVVVE